MTVPNLPARVSKLGLIAALILLCSGMATAQEPPTNTAPTSLADTVKNLLTESSQDLAEGDYESAIRDASTAIQLDPKNASAYELRGSVYIEEKLWDRAERDYTSAEKISPDAVYQYKLGEIKFLAKAYEDARPRFAALEGDERLGSLATYKVFLCDLLGRHEDAAQRDLAALDAGERIPAYYFSHAAWDLYHADHAGATKCFGAADQLYDRSVSEIYIASLLESRRFHLASATFVAKDGTPYENASAFLESDGLRVSTAKGWVTVPFDQLPDDLSSFPEDLREQIDRKRAVVPDAPRPVSLVSFTTRSGQSYDHVRWSVVDTGLSVLTADGWITVPFRDLPADQSSFPADLRQALSLNRTSLLAPAPSTELVSFTTIHGKSYQQVKALVTDDGLRVLTPDGWITVPFRDLPADLSGFPVDWQAQIQSGRQAPVVDASGMETITFTTVKGVHYDQVRAALGRSGLRLVTSDGWVEVPFNELPQDKSVFPEEWRETISVRAAEMAKAKSGGY